jgi:hypothetical protein
MRNITIALDDDTYFRVEKEAERKNKSVTEFAKSTLIEASMPWTSPVSPEEFKRLAHLEAELRAQITDFRASDILPRDELYDRKRFR